MKLKFDALQTHMLKTLTSNRGFDSCNEDQISSVVMIMVTRELKQDAEILAQHRAANATQGRVAEVEA